jgi:hypothetical protein
MANIIGGSRRRFATGMLKKPTASADKKDALMIGDPVDKNKTVNFISPAMAPPIQIVIKILRGTLKRMPKPTAAQPHQKVLKSMSAQFAIFKIYRQ